MNAIDRLIAFFSPEKALRRQFYRAKLENARQAKYAAAKTDRMTGAWSPVNSNVNEIIKGSSAAVRARVRQLVRDFPYFARAVQILSDYVVGPGIVFQSRIKNPDGQLDAALNQQVEDVFKFWADDADIQGKLHYYELMELAQRQSVESGEFVLVRTVSRGSKNYLPYQLQMFEADWLSDNPARNYQVPPSNELDQGVEFKKATGRVVAYHFTDPDDWGDAVRIRASQVIHGFKTLRPGQLRGISPFTPAILIARDLGEYIDAEIDAAKLAAKYLAFVETPNPLDRQTGSTVDSDTGQRIEEMENAIIEYLMPGEEIEIAKHDTTGSNFSPFVELILTMVAVALNVPYELLSGNYKGFSYSTGRLSRNDFAQQLRPLVVRHVRHFAMPTINTFYQYAVMSGKLPFSDYFSNVEKYRKMEWQPPGMEAVDPMRETKSKIDEIKALIRSPQEVVAARGRDLEEVYKEIALAKRMAEEYDLDWAELSGDVSTALANNPAAVEKQKSARKTLKFRKRK